MNFFQNNKIHLDKTKTLLYNDMVLSECDS